MRRPRSSIFRRTSLSRAHSVDASPAPSDGGRADCQRRATRGAGAAALSKWWMVKQRDKKHLPVGVVPQSGVVGARAGWQRQHLHGGGACQDLLLQRQRRRQLEAAHPHQRHGTVLVLLVAPDLDGHQGTSGHAWRSPAKITSPNCSFTIKFKCRELKTTISEKHFSITSQLGPKMGQNLAKTIFLFLKSIFF